MFFRLLLICLFVAFPVCAQEIIPKFYQLSEIDMQKAYLEVAQSFIDAKTADEASKYISSTNSEKFQAAFENQHCKKEIVLDEKCHVFTHNMSQYGMVRNTVSPGQKEFLFMVWHADMITPKVDWKGSYSWGGMTWEQFLKEMPEIPIEMRVTVKAGNYYNYQFSEESVWQCLKFYLDVTDETMYAYVRRDNSSYKYLMSEIQKKGASSITAKLAYPEGEKQQTQVELVEMLSETA